MSDSFMKATEWIDTVQKGKDIITCIQSADAVDRVDGLIILHPEVKSFTHETIAFLLGLQRETVSRAFGALGIQRRCRK